MRRSSLAIVSIALFVAVVAGGCALMVFSPRGVLNPDGPEEAMQSCIDTGTYVWRDEFCRLYTAETTVFEDSSAVTGRLFDALVGNGSLTFREYEGVSTGAAPVFILSGKEDFLTVRMEYTNGAWQVGELAVPETLFTPETYTVTVTVPPDTEVFLNGIAVDKSYIESDSVPYDDITPLEARFDTVPCRVRYAVPGIYENVQVSVSREDGAVLESANGFDWVYTTPDAGAYSFSVTAPMNAVVTVNGAELSAADCSAEVRMTALVDIPTELEDTLPVCYLYEATGLYSQPEIRAVDETGAALTPVENADGSLTFPAAGSDALYDAFHERVEQFIENVCEYGAGHTTRAYPADYVVPDSELFWYFRNAVSSLYWVQGVTVSYHEVSSCDYVPLGEDAFLCRANVKCTSRTGYQTADLDLSYEMLWVNRNGQWLAADMAFDHFERTKVS